MTEAGCCDRAAAYCRGRAATSWTEAERERWQKLAETNEANAERLRRIQEVFDQEQND